MIRVEALRNNDLVESAQMHLQHLHLGLFPRLGRGFLRAYHQSFIDSPHAVALVARDDDNAIVGVLMGTVSNSEHYRWVVRNRGWRLAAAGSLALVRRPVVAAQFLATRGTRYGRAIMRRLVPASAAVEGPTPAPQLSVLSHIVTGVSARRKGIGRRLVSRFADGARDTGAKRIVLVTEEGGLGAPFFERIGARLTAQRRGQDGVTVREYAMSLGDGSAYERGVEDRRGRSAVRPFHGRTGAATAYGAIPHHGPSC